MTMMQHTRYLAILLLFVARTYPAAAASPPSAAGHSKSQVANLDRPYEDRAQQEIPFGQWSYDLAPWRAYMDTWPADRFLECLGLNFNVSPEDADATAEVCATAGFRAARVEIGWGNMAWDDPSQLQPGNAKRYTSILQALRKHHIRPIVLLNAHSGAPCPLRMFDVALTKPAAEGALEIYLDPSQCSDIRPQYTGLTGIAKRAVACPLITQIDASQGKCRLSMPLAKALPAGKIRLCTLKYRPFGGAVLEDGRVNTAAAETIAGWKAYVAGITAFLRQALGTQDAADAGFDMEVWNEYTFGSEFLNDTNYYHPAIKYRDPITYSSHGRTAKGCEVILPITVDYVNDPANKLPGVRVISGFSNQRPWESGSGLWPGQAGFSRHYYTNLGGTGELPDAKDKASINALGKSEKVCTYVPKLMQAMPEMWHFAYKTEFFTRDIQPFPGPWKQHHRYSHNGDGRPAEVWMTETNLWREPFADELIKKHGVEKSDPRLAKLMHSIGAKALLRLFTFSSHKGVKTITAFAAKGGDTSFGMLPDKFFDALKAEGHQYTPTVRAEVGPQFAALARLAAKMRTGVPLAGTRPISVNGLVEHQPRLVVAGNGTPEHPDHYNREDFACLPFQLDERRFAIAYYVVTRDLAHSWDKDRDLLDPARYDMPDQTFDLSLGNVCGKGAELSVFDPRRGATEEIKAESQGPGTLTVRLKATDSPRLLLIKEAKAGPVILAADLKAARQKAELHLSTNGVGAMTVTWGPIPQRTALGTRKLSAAKEVDISLPVLGRDVGVQTVVRDNGLIAVWPRWGYDTAGVLLWSPPTPK